MFRKLFVFAILLMVALPAYTLAAIRDPYLNSSGTMVHPLVHSDLSPALRDIPPAPRRSGIHQAEPWRRTPHSFASDRPITGTLDDALQTSALPSPMAPAVTNQFNGIGSNNGYTVNSAPPDTNGDVSSLYYVQIVNTDFAVFNKSTGAYVFGPVAVNTLWSGFGGGCQTNNDGDPTVTYDQLADRWIITQFSVSTTPYLECVAVSQTNNPTGSWFRYSYSFGNTNFPDYPKLGMMSDGGSMNAYFITYNIFANGSTFAGADVCAYNRATMLTGTGGSMICKNTGTNYGGVLAADLDGSTVAPSGSPEFVLSQDAAGTGLVYFTAVPTFSTSTMTFSGATAISGVTAFTDACGGGTCIPQSGTTQKLDSLADRLMNRLQYRNFAGSPKMVVSHSVGSSVSGARWYQFNVSGSTVSLAQQGTFSPDAIYRWMPSIAMDSTLDIALGYSTSSSNLHPGVAFTGHAVGDAANSMQAETVAFTGAGSQTGSLSRWGDYSNMSIDPVDDCTFWFTTEYLPSNGSFNWATRIVNFKFPGCGGSPTPDFSVSASPSSVTVAQGSNGTSTITVASINNFNSAVTLSASGLPSGVTAAFVPPSVIPPANSSGTSTLTLTASASATTGPATVTVTGTLGATTHTANINLTVTLVDTTNPTTSLTAPAPGPVTGTIAVSANANDNVGVTKVEFYDGVNLIGTDTTSPYSINWDTTTVVNGSHTLTSKAYDAANNTGTSAGVIVTVSNAVSCGTASQLLGNPGFESGATIWVQNTTGLITNSVSRPAHTGTWYAHLNGLGVTSNHTIYQAITIPANACSAQLTFWVRIDTAETTTTKANDKLMIQVGTKPRGSWTYTTLGTFSNLDANSTYVQKTFDLSAYKGQTIRVRFGGKENNSLQTTFVIDDTAVNITQ